MYLSEFVTIALVHLVAVASPGPDFAVVLRNSIAYGRQTAIYTSLGIGVGILLHVAYSLVGLSVLIQSTPWLFTTFSFLAAGYLVYLAIGALKSQPGSVTSAPEEHRLGTLSHQKAFWSGFLTNGLNPKATLFFLSLFTAIISTETPFPIKLAYGIYLSIATAAWFCLLSYLLSTSKVANLIGKNGYWLDRAMGVILLGLAAKLVLL
ncbi:LysE family translocator [Alteromonas aestuariivivens]|uniref:LysE family translocator n=1 Tax=Alteromonas aestuariivivens TaxID=1938339 RepID=A0A3D8M3C5_9ALTE|nr:LysE family translocator [Alteromonas aestuariivivens]RDV24141.1 LysE family translocator [Alteromonas aestuariivivens]